MDAIFIAFKDMRVLVLTRWDEKYFRDMPSLEIDLLVLCNNPRVNIPLLKERFNVSRIIADGSNYTSYIREIESACLDEGILFHSIAAEGYFHY